MRAVNHVCRGTFKGVVVGASAGGPTALAAILSQLPDDYPLPILVVQHLHPDDGGAMAEGLQLATGLNVVTPRDKQPLAPATVFVAPANYHVLCDRGGHIALTVDERVKWSRPSIDVLFESAAHAWGRRTIAVLLSGSNADGAAGMRTVRKAGGLTMAQDPECAVAPIMPQAAIDMRAAREVLTISQIAHHLVEQGEGNV